MGPGPNGDLRDARRRAGCRRRSSRRSRLPTASASPDRSSARSHAADDAGYRAANSWRSSRTSARLRCVPRTTSSPWTRQPAAELLAERLHLRLRARASPRRRRAAGPRSRRPRPRAATLARAGRRSTATTARRSTAASGIAVQPPPALIRHDQVLPPQVLDVPRQTRARGSLEERRQLQLESGGARRPDVEAGSAPEPTLEVAQLRLRDSDALGELTLRQACRQCAGREVPFRDAARDTTRVRDQRRATVATDFG